MPLTANSPVEAYEQRQVAVAQQRGFALFPIRADDACPYGFIYSMGMKARNLPELLCYFADEAMAQPTYGLLTNLCHGLLQAEQRFGRDQTLVSFCRRELHAVEPNVVYQPKLLTGDSYRYALDTVVTRAVRYRDQFGGVPQVIELRHEGVPSIDGIRAELMLAASL